jgi:hypothetical protein
MCFVVLLGAVLPRVTLALLWLFTEWLDVLRPWWLGVLGFLFLPYTTLAYTVIHRYSGDVSVNNVVHLIVMIVALVFDLGAWGGSRTHYHRRRVVVAN